MERLAVDGLAALTPALSQPWEGETLPASFKIRAGWINRVGNGYSFSGNAAALLVFCNRIQHSAVLAVCQLGGRSCAKSTGQLAKVILSVCSH